MGIKGLGKAISDVAPRATSPITMETLQGRVLAIDISCFVYQFLLCKTGGPMLSDKDGNTTQHLQGIFSRMLKMISLGIKPICVLDGESPELKKEELAKRRERREAAEKKLESGEDKDDKQIESLKKIAFRVEKERYSECEKLLKLMGIPVIRAPSEGEAQCAYLVKEGIAYAGVSEDTDLLPLNCARMIRGFGVSMGKQKELREISLAVVLEDMGLSMDQFVDYCILLGCDFSDRIHGIGPVKALDLIKEFKSIEKIIGQLDKSKHPLPPRFDFQQVRGLFKEPEVKRIAKNEIKWEPVQEEELLKFLVEEKQFQKERVERAITLLKESTAKKAQMRVTDYFAQAKVTSANPKDSSGKKKRSLTQSDKGKKKVKTGVRPRGK